MSIDDQEFARRARRLEWLLFDVDGVLTDGSLYYTREGERLKRFHVRDGLALRLAQRAGLKVGLFSGRSSPALEARAAELGLDEVILGSHDKASDFERFLARRETTPERVAYAGDDLIDLAVLGRAGLSFAPADAAPEVRAAVGTVLAAAGGRGAAREMVEAILKARGDWDGIVARYSAAG